MTPTARTHRIFCRLRSALALLDQMDDDITERGGDDDAHGRRDLAKIRRCKDHIRRAEKDVAETQEWLR